MTLGKENPIRENEWKKLEHCSIPKRIKNLEKDYQDGSESGEESLRVSEGSSHLI